MAAPTPDQVRAAHAAAANAKFEQEYNGDIFQNLCASLMLTAEKNGLLCGRRVLVTPYPDSARLAWLAPRLAADFPQWSIVASYDTSDDSCDYIVFDITEKPQNGGQTPQ